MGALQEAKEAFAGQRAFERQLRVVKPREPVLVKVGKFAAKALGQCARARTAVLALGGFGFLSAAAWTFNLAAGLAAVGVSLLVLEYLLTGSDK